VIWVRYVARHWKNSHSAIELATLVRRVAVSAVVSYAVAVFALRLLMATTGQTGLDSDTPLVSSSLLLVTVAAAVVALSITRRQAQRNSSG
jgi:hypothetical protein